MGNELAHELDFALRLADAADASTLPRFRDRAFAVSTKQDQSVVTEVDRDTEAALVAMINAERPHHGWHGEEHGEESVGEWQWVIDPIDATSNFVRGVPVYATLIALVHAEAGPVLGVVSAPALDTRWWGVVDDGAYLNGSPIRVSDTAMIYDAHLSATPNSEWNRRGKSQGIARLTQTVARVRGFGDFWQHMLVAQGSIDAAVDAIGLGPYDIAALVPIVRAAGGRATTLEGVTDWRADHVITSNGVLHDEVLALLNS